MQFLVYNKQMVRIKIGQIVRKLFIGFALVLIMGFFVPDLDSVVSSVSPEVPYVVIGEFALGVDLVGLVMTDKYQDRQRIQQWFKVLSAPHEPTPNPPVQNSMSICHLSDGALKHLALDTYRSLGCRVIDFSDEGEPYHWIIMKNPQGNTELVHLIPGNEPAELQHLGRLQKAMYHEKTVHGTLWAPAGYSSGLDYWIKKKKISLVDYQGIARIHALARQS